jgi:hypothetical protein
VRAGIYEGTYVVGRDDRIEADSRVTASLWVANHSTTVVLEEPAGAGRGAAARLP